MQVRLKPFRPAAVLFWFAFSLLASAAPPPSPFTPVEITAQRFTCLGRVTEFGDFLLPKQATAGDRPVLASPVRLVTEPNVLDDLRGHAAIRSNDGDSATVEWSAESADLRAASKLTADCDGFCWYEIRFEPKHPIKLKSLRLEIPRVAGTARYLHTSAYNWSNVSGGLPEMGGKWASAFVPYVWLGDEQRGLAWCAESDQGWHPAATGTALSVETKDDVVTFRANLLEGERTLDKPLTLRFGLQATPVKPVGFAWRAKARILHDIHYASADVGADGKCELDAIRDGGAKTVIIHDSWTKYFGQVQPADAAAFRKLIDACHQRGLRLLVYVGYGVARNAPEMTVDDRHAKWSVLPLIPWDPGYKPETRAFDATCPRSGWADWLVAGTDKLFADYDLDGLYFDGTSAAWVCQNEAHGCGWHDEQGHLHPTYALLEARQLMRRIADTVHKHKPDAILDVHMSSNMTMPTLAFCDSAWNGEQFEGHTKAEKFNVPLAAFRTEFMGYAHGIDTEFLCYENRPFTFTEAIALAWMHGVEVRPYPQNLHYVTPIWRAMDAFGMPDARWVPYWSAQPAATCDDPDVKASAWVHDGGRALLFVSHLQRNAAKVHVRLDANVLGLTQGDVQAKDAITGTPVTFNNGAAELSFDGMTFHVLRIGD